MGFLIALVARAAPQVADRSEAEWATDLDPGVDLRDRPAPVVGGTEATPGRWPDAAALYTIDGTFGCSGTLVAPDLVLTAGHCGFGMDHVLVGTDDQRDPASGETIGIAESIVHPDHTTTFDIAVLVLEAEATTVAPRTLALDCVAGDHLVDGSEVAIVGYGATDVWATEWTTALMEAWTTIRDAECIDPAAGCNATVSPGGELVAGGEGIDSCQGDSGGPLYVATPAGDFLAGTTSRAALPLVTPCGGGGIYVRADAIAPWVEEVTGRTLPRPECEGWNSAPRPTAPALVGARGSIAATRIAPGDPNAEDGHTFRIVEGPAQGEAGVQPDGLLFLWLPLDAAAGSDEIVVEVTDDGDPPQTGTATVEVVLPERAPPNPSSGCATLPVTSGPIVLVLIVASSGLRARRRSGRLPGSRSAS